MLCVTQTAAERLREMLLDAPPDTAVRFVPVGRRLAMELDEPHSDDTSFTHEDRTVLLLAPGVAQALRDLTLDLRETLEGWKLTLHADGE